jgi:urea transport system substrate-binding protein
MKRKAIKPVFEENNGLLFYRTIRRLKAVTFCQRSHQSADCPGSRVLLEQGKTKFFLLGSDYVFPRTSNTIIKAQLEASEGATTVGEEYVPLGGTEFSTIIEKIRAAAPDVIFNTLNGDSNVAFFKQYKDAGYGADTLPTMSVSIAEEEVKAIGTEYLLDHLVAWNYYQTVDTPANTTFVEAFKAKYGEDSVTSDPMEAGYFGVYLWAAAVEAAGSTDVEAVKAAAGGITFEAPEGTVTIDGDNQHTFKKVLIGQVREDGLIDTIWSTEEAVKPDPYLCTYEWAAALPKPEEDVLL